MRLNRLDKVSILKIILAYSPLFNIEKLDHFVNLVMKIFLFFNTVPESPGMLVTGSPSMLKGYHNSLIDGSPSILISPMG